MKDALGDVQSVLVLGGTSDIAQAICCKVVSRRSARLVLAVRKPESCDAIASELRAAGASAVDTVPFDATDFASHESFVRSTFDRFGDFDVVIVAFGINPDQAQAERSAAMAVDIAQTNYTGAVSVSIPLANRLREQGHGALVLLSSVAGERVRRTNFVYGSSKAGIDGFYQGLAAALEGSGVTVTIVRPGFVHTKMTEGHKVAPLATTPDKVADATVKAIANGTEIVWVPGAFRFVMFAFRHTPTWLFRRLPI
jgi:decaprenylphospho-beta-D-erythro-pentofuranosid-2-ulose 2-reductase